LVNLRTSEDEEEVEKEVEEEEEEEEDCMFILSFTVFVFTDFSSNGNTPQSSSPSSFILRRFIISKNKKNSIKIYGHKEFQNKLKYI
jgi:hypothetical protein